MKRTSIRIVSVCVALVLVSSACGGSSDSTTTTTAAPIVKKEIVATTSIIGDFVTVLTAGTVDVKVLVPQNADVQKYTLTPADVTTIANADLLIQNGLGLEPWFDSYIKGADHKAAVVNATNGIATRKNESGALDPFVWVSPSNARFMVANIRQALAALLPNSASQFAANERGYGAQIDSVVSYAQSTMASVRGKRLAYVGEPLGYFCDQFAVQCTGIAVTGLASGPPNATQVTSVVDAIKAANPHAVIFGGDIPPAVVDATTKALPTARSISGNEALRVSSVGDQSRRHADYLLLGRDIADAVSAGLR